MDIDRDNRAYVLSAGDLVTSKVTHTRLYLEPDMRRWDSNLKGTCAIYISGSIKASRGDPATFFWVAKLLTPCGIRYAYQVDIDIVEDNEEKT